MRNVYFDVCGTLFETNTTYGFIRFFHLREGSYLKYLHVLILSGFLGKILNRFFDVSIRRLMLKTIEGESKELIYKNSDLYVEWLFVNKKNKKLFSILNQEAENSNVVLLSASIDPVISSLSSKLKVESFSSNLKYSDGFFIGGFENDLKGSKESVLRLRKNNFRFYTDNFEDVGCVEYVDELFFVIKNNKYYSKERLSKIPDNVEVIYV